MTRFFSAITLSALVTMTMLPPPLYGQPVTDGQGDVIIGGAIPHVSALLDLQSTSKGLLLPRMTEAERDNIFRPATGLVIYNTDDDEFQYNFGTELAPMWERLVTSGNFNDIAWLIDGNSGTDPTQHFLGTLDPQALVIKTDNVEHIRVTETGEVGIGTPTPGSSIDGTKYKVDMVGGPVRIDERLIVTEPNLETPRTLISGNHVFEPTMDTNTNPADRLNQYFGVNIDTYLEGTAPNASLFGAGFFAYGRQSSNGGLYGTISGTRIDQPANITLGIPVLADMRLLDGGASLQWANPFQAYFEMEGGSVNTYVGLYNHQANIVGGNIGLYTGIWLDNRAANGVIRDNIGLYMADQSAIGSGQNYAMYINGGRSYFRDNIGVGITNPRSKLHVDNGDIYVNDSPRGVILKSPNGQCWRITVDNTGTLTTTNIACP